MVSKVKTFSLNGINTIDIDVECQLASGMVNFIIVGLADKAVAESRDRIRAVFSSLGLSFPSKKLVINLSPADLYKIGNHYDLPIILSILVSMKLIPQEAIDKFYVMGELSLDGNINSVSGILPSAINANSKNMGIIIPSTNVQEALWANDKMNILAPKNIIEIINHFKNNNVISVPEKITKNEIIKHPDFKDVKGQESAKRATEITAAGGHNLLMSGPPGSGKSMIAERIAGILPDFETEEILETSMIASVSGNLKEGKLITNRPFRAPHHNCSMPALVGGGQKALPGDISLAHNGVLFLDELPEFPRQVLDSLRQPLEDREVTVSRVNNHVTYPANFQLIAAMNPCKCGYLDDASRACSRAPKCANEYQMKISGPLLDRFDIQIDVPQQNPLEAYNKSNTETSQTIKKRVVKARNFQANRYKNEELKLNKYLKGNDLIKFCQMNPDAESLFNKGVEKLNLSMRGHAKTLKLARTIADMDESDIIKRNHIAEALSYRIRAF